MNILGRVVRATLRKPDVHRVCEPVVADTVVNEHSSEFEVNNWVLSKFLIDRLIPIVGVHPFPLNELLLMAGAICRVKPTHIFEWGTHRGVSARVFYETAQWSRLRVEIHSVDLPDDVQHIEHPGKQRGDLIRGLRGIKLYEGDGLSTSLQICKQVKPRRPLFFLDGDHAYESVMRELAGIITHVSHANILVHDTFYQSPDSGYNVGPYNAIKDSLATLPHQFRVVSANTGLPGMTLLYQAGVS